MKNARFVVLAMALLLSGRTALAGSTISVGDVSPVVATADVSQRFRADYSSVYTIESCQLYVDGQNEGSMILSGSLSGTASASFTFEESGSYSVYVRCQTVFGNVASSSSATVTVSDEDTDAPSRPGSLTVTSSESDNTPSFSWDASTDDTAVARYEIQIDDGAFAPVGDVTSYTASPMADGTYTFGVRAVDGSGNVSSAASVIFSIDTGASDDDGTDSLLDDDLIPPFGIDRLEFDAQLIANAATRAHLEGQTGRGCEWASATASAQMTAILGTITNATARTAIENFVACGTVSTHHLGAGERLGIVNSYRAAFGRTPSTGDHWEDIVKIGNGRFTAEVSTSAEANATATFKEIYLRDANMGMESDRNAVYIMAYGLRPLPRDLNSEVTAIVTFRAVYGDSPSSATDWDAVRATAYSGATR